MSAFIDKAHEMCDSVTYEDMVALALVLRERLDAMQ
jgi:hypothetical protein